MQAEPVLRCGNMLGEGVIWSGRHREIMWTDILGRRLWRFDTATGLAKDTILDARLCSFVPLAGTRLLAGFDDGLYDFDVVTGRRTLIAAIESEQPTTRLNDGKIDRQGRLVFGTMDEAPEGPQAIAHLWRFEGVTPPQMLFPGVKISNGLCFSPDGRRMYFADTPNRRIEMFDYDPASGAIENRRTFATLGDGAGWPDGSAVDCEGFVWNAEWNGGRVVRYDPDGKIERIVTVPVPLVTCCAFGGDGLKQLYITTARVSLEDEALRKAPLSGGLFVCEPDTAGIADAEFGTPF